MVRTRLTTGGLAEPVVADTAKSLSKNGTSRNTASMG